MRPGAGLIPRLCWHAGFLRLFGTSRFVQAPAGRGRRLGWDWSARPPRRWIGLRVLQTPEVVEGQRQAGLASNDRGSSMHDNQQERLMTIAELAWMLGIPWTPCTAGVIEGWVRAVIASAGMCGIDAALLRRGCHSRPTAGKTPDSSWPTSRSESVHGATGQDAPTPLPDIEFGIESHRADCGSRPSSSSGGRRRRAEVKVALAGHSATLRLPLIPTLPLMCLPRHNWHDQRRASGSRPAAGLRIGTPDASHVDWGPGADAPRPTFPCLRAGAC